MLKILFSPSEGKNQGGNFPSLNSLLFDIDKRKDILDNYNKVVLSDDLIALKKMFGIKKESEFDRFCKNIYEMPTCKAINRYKGVAYEYLDIKTLDKSSTDYLEKNCIIFSNLYGPILGGDLITDYKVKQGEAINSILPEHYYKRTFSGDLDLYLENSEILDLRAGYYDKFYKPVREYMTLKFIKDEKVISHWAKAYRGIVLRELAKAQINSLSEFRKLDIPSLHVKEIKTIKLKTEIVFEIV
jgi:cytoplasmic iron level regulating protein YaaA (DUF328/UPF0246 family)